MSFQQVTIAGYLAKDPETRYLQSGDPVCNFSIPIGEKWRDKDTGETKERTTWFNCVAYKKIGEIAGEYLKKGSFPIISGKITTGEFENKEGQKVRTWSLTVDKLDLGPRVAGNEAGSTTSAPAPRQQELKQQKSADGDFIDDIPFILNECMFDTGTKLDRRINRNKF